MERVVVVGTTGSGKTRLAGHKKTYGGQAIVNGSITISLVSPCPCGRSKRTAAIAESTPRLSISRNILIFQSCACTHLAQQMSG
jgi:tRNA A37 N6-isopentenylltransferase MiaA